VLTGPHAQGCVRLAIENGCTIGSPTDSDPFAASFDTEPVAIKPAKKKTVSKTRGIGSYNAAILAVGVVGLAVALWVRANHWKIQLIEADSAASIEPKSKPVHTDKPALHSEPRRIAVRPPEPRVEVSEEATEVDPAPREPLAIASLVPAIPRELPATKATSAEESKPKTEPAPPVGPQPEVKPADHSSKKPTEKVFGKWIDVLKAVDVAKHGVAGKWARRGTDIVIEEAPRASRVVIPYLPSDSYEMTVEFTRTKGHVTNLIVPVNKKYAMLSLELDGGGHGMFSGPQEAKVSNDARHKVEITVQADPKEKTAAVQISLDGNRIKDWKGSLDEVKLYEAWGLPSPALMGLGVDESSTVAFHVVKVREQIKKHH
jgi:hypothetical protein